jgi:hypothetical protein
VVTTQPWLTFEVIQPLWRSRVVFYIWILHQNPKFVAIDKEADDDIMYFFQLGETNGLANQPFDPRPQG